MAKELEKIKARHATIWFGGRRRATSQRKAARTPASRDSDAMDLVDTAAMDLNDMDAMDLDDSNTLTTNLPPMTARPEGVAGSCSTPPTIREVQGARAAGRCRQRYNTRLRKLRLRREAIMLWRRRMISYVLFSKALRILHLRELRVVSVERNCDRPPD